jgi:ATP-dependent DNA helicase RecQ
LQNLQSELEEVSALDLKWANDRLCTFSVRRINFGGIKAHTTPDNWEQILSVYHNLIIRGSPTYPAIQVERFLLESVSKTVPIPESDDRQNIVFRDKLPGVLKEAWVTVLAQAHSAIDPEFATPPEKMDSPEEKSFLDVLSRKLGPSILQLVECQRPFNTIAGAEEETIFHDQRVDFALETGDSKFILEIDGAQHQESKQRMLDEKRDRFLRQNKWEVIRIPASDVRHNQIDTMIQDFSECFRTDPFLLASIKSFTNPLSSHDAGRAALYLVMVPFAIARIQWAILSALKTGCLDIRQPKVKIAIIEWDVPCGFLAVWDFINSINHLKDMAGVKSNFPQIELEIFRNADFGLADGIDTLDYSDITVRVSREFARLRKERFDIIVSASTLQIGLRSIVELVGQNACIAVDTAYSPRGSSPQIESTVPIHYPLNQNQAEHQLTFFLQWIFRKRKFREGQLEILMRSLALQDVIGLLPTSGGKSLCYQLSALLQPGTTLVIDPIISLMADQTENLRRLEIDAIGLVSSNQNREEQKEALQRLVQRRVLLFFISPERLQIPTFRATLESVCQETPVPYLVIDEAHCISEWGHDFRPSYLKLVDNGKKSCRYPGGYIPRIIALTGTASSVVLSDIQRVIGLKDDAIVTPETYDRTELEFESTRCSSFQKWPTLKAKLLEIPGLFDQPQDHSFNPNNAGIIFCPHVRGKFGIGVARNISQELRQLIPDTRIFGGRPAVGYTHDEWKQLKIMNQTDFKQNKATLMVATKAFGMGIDKPNIRFTIHYSMPTSLEAFYQEAGRAGRDGAKADCTLMYSGDISKWREIFDPNLSVEIVNSKIASTLERDDIYRMLWFHSNNWQGVENEYKEIKMVIDSILNPTIKKLKLDETALITIPFEGGIAAADEDNDSRTRMEKRLYRLSVLGLVVDYGLDHNARMFEVEVVRRNDDYLKAVLLDYVCRYKPTEYRDRFSVRIANAHGSTILEKCLRTFLEFVYEEIEKKRRRMILHMAEVAESPDNATFRRAIISYLETSEFTKKLDKLSKQMNPQEWVDIVSNIDDINSAQRLLAGCRRTLESYPDHPGLLLLSWYARQLTSDKTALDEFERATKSLANSTLDDHLREQTLANMIKEVASEQPNAIPALCYVALQEFPRREIARIALTYSDISSKTGDLALRVLLGFTHQKVQTVRQHITGGDRS